MNEQSPSSSPVEFKDRSTGLVVFGILTILLGCLCVLLVPLMIFSQTLATRASHEPANFHAIIPAIYMYAVMAAGLIWLGIGSIKTRRWARALLLIFSWSWLITGVVMLTFMAITLPQFMAGMQSAAPPGQPALPPAAKLTMMLIPLLMMTVIFIILPVIWVFFYQSRHVKVTCETRDPAARWTDNCPLPVLAASLWLGVSAPSILVTSFTNNGVLPFFGALISGLPGMLLYLVLAAVLGYCAWAMYKLNLAGWWLVFIGLCLFCISNILTYSRHDVMEAYRLMGYPEAQIEQIQKISLFTTGHMAWASLLFMVPFLGYLLYVRKYFRPKS